MILKRRAFVLSMMLAFIGAMTLTQCKKTETPTDDPMETPTNTPVLPEGETVTITLTVNQSKDEKLTVEPPYVRFDEGDTLYVGSNGIYVGYLLYDDEDSKFKGTVTGATDGYPLYFYMLGNRGINSISWILDDAGTTGCSVNISNQYNFFAGQPSNKQLPVISYAPSNETYTGSQGITEFTAILRNQCALVKFDVTNPDGFNEPITLHGVNNIVTINFGSETPFAFSQLSDNNTINVGKRDDGYYWAILLPQEAMTEVEVTSGIYEGTIALPTINNNAYLSEGIAVSLHENPLFIPLTFEAMEAGASVTFTKAPTIAELPIEYSLNGGTWTTYSTPIPLTNIGDKVSFRGNNAKYANAGQYSCFSCDKDCYIYGNVMSLVDKESFATNTTLTQRFTFCHLFGNFDSSTNQNAPNPHLYNHSSKTLVLPATTLISGCYFDMFNGCTHLTTAPVLLATTLASSCYEGMFSGCTSLAATPTLSATTLAESCYQSMFSGCTSLTTAPELAVTDLTNKYSCYRSMFSGCTNLTAAPALPSTTIALECYKNMFKDCTSLTTAPTLPATTLYNGCYDGMFSGCTNLTTAPALPATTLTERCYREMFKNCTNLTTAPALPATTLTLFCYKEMFNGCTHLNSVTCLATNISATQCTLDWLSGVAATGTFTKASGITWPSGASGIPSGWTVNEHYDPLATPLTFEAKTAGATVSFTLNAENPVEYSTDGSTWNTYSSGTAITLATVGDKVMFRGNNATYFNLYTNDYSRFSCTNECYIYGNIMSLIDATDYATTTTMTSSNDKAFMSLFANNTNIKNHTSKNLVLPATTLATSCYMGMFSGCTGLTTAPALPATNLAEYCYTMMFFNCTSLTAAPALPATTMTTGCYQNMFAGTGLTSAPELPAVTLASYCYSGMFVACTSLTTASTLPATTLADYCYYNMFSSCTSLTSAPELPASVLAPNCYEIMFEDCTNLKSVTCLATDISASNCTYNWLFGVADSGTFTKAATMSSWPIGPDGVGYVHGIPSGWTVEDYNEL